MRPLREVHAVVPAGIDDPERPSGGNTYDRRVLGGLRASGWQLRVHPVPGPWPWPDSSALAALEDVVATVPAGAVLLVDGLVASCADGVLVRSAPRHRLVILVHMPLGPSDVAAADGEGRVLRAAAAVITTSRWTRDGLLDAYGLAPDAVHVAHPGVDPAPAAVGTPGGGCLLCVAAVAPRKGQADLVTALGQVRDLSWSCALAGALTRSPDFVAGLRDRIEREGLAERVQLLGALGADALGREYAAADLLVLPSHAETYGMVVTEALARGVPVLATAVGGVPEALGGGGGVGDPGLLVPARRPDALAEALRGWLGDPDLRRRLREGAAHRRESLPMWSMTTDQVASVLSRVNG